MSKEIVCEINNFCEMGEDFLQKEGFTKDGRLKITPKSSIFKKMPQTIEVDQRKKYIDNLLNIFDIENVITKEELVHAIMNNGIMPSGIKITKFLYRLEKKTLEKEGRSTNYCIIASLLNNIKGKINSLTGAYTLHTDPKSMLDIASSKHFNSCIKRYSRVKTKINPILYIITDPNIGVYLIRDSDGQVTSRFLIRILKPVKKIKPSYVVYVSEIYGKKFFKFNPKDYISNSEMHNYFFSRSIPNCENPIYLTKFKKTTTNIVNTSVWPNKFTSECLCIKASRVD